jgi:protein-disulfide isomerase
MRPRWRTTSSNPSASGVSTSASNPARDGARLVVPVTERDHIRGRMDAPIVLVEYGDYECPVCGRAYWAVKRLQKTIGDDLAFVFRNFPITEVHPRAQSVAEALEAAAVQGCFWEMHDWFYEHQHELEGLDLEQHARTLGLDLGRWKRDVARRAYADAVRSDIEGGRASGVHGTPTFFVNGVRHDGPRDFDGLLAAVNDAAAGA